MMERKQVSALYKGNAEEFEISPPKIADQLCRVARDKFGIGLRAVETKDANGDRREIALEDLDDWVFDTKLCLELIGDLDHCFTERKTENEIQLHLRCKNEPCRVSDLGGHGVMFTLPIQHKELTYRPKNGTWRLTRCERLPDGVIAVLERNSSTVFVSDGGDFSRETVDYPDIFCHAGDRVSIVPKIQGSPSLFRSASKLPDGLVVDPVSGILAGIPKMPIHDAEYLIMWNDNQASAGLINVLPTPSETKHFDCGGRPTGMCGMSEFLYVSVGSCLKRVHISSGIMEIVAGSEHSGFDGDGRSASFARFNDIRGLCAYEGDVYLCDCGNHRIRKYCVKENVVTTIAGDGAFGSTGDGGLAQLASLAKPYDCCVHDKKLYILEYSTVMDGQIRVLDLCSGIISSYCRDCNDPHGLTTFNGELVWSERATSCTSRLRVLQNRHILGCYAQLLCPGGICGTARGIFACDKHLRRVVFLNPLKGCSEVFKMDLVEPWGVCFHENQLFVSDAGSNRVVHW